ncbi:MAG: hypothetical protein ABSG67_22725 [Thermoguttaceae bacterium]
MLSFRAGHLANTTAATAAITTITTTTKHPPGLRNPFRTNRPSSDS